MGRFLLILLLLITACSSHTPKSVRREGERRMRRLTSQLEQVRSREELLQALPELRKTYLEIARLGVEAQQAIGKGEDSPLLDEALNRRLCQELVRIYALEGGREMIESAQRDALHHLVHAELH